MGIEKILELFPFYTSFSKQFMLGKSYINHAPLYYQQKHTVEYILNQQAKGIRIVAIDARDIKLNSIYYRGIWNRITKDSGYIAQHIIDDPFLLQAELPLFLSHNSRELIFTIDVNSIKKSNCFFLINAFVLGMNEVPAEKRMLVSLIIYDDYTTYFKQKEESSFSWWDGLEQNFLQPLTQPQTQRIIEAVLKNNNILDEEIIKQVSACVFMLCGGHHGLTFILCEYLSYHVRAETEYDIFTLAKQIRQQLTEHETFLAIEEFIKHNLPQIRKVLNEEERGSIINEDNIAVDKKLFTIGILNRHYLESEICPGMIRKSVLQHLRKENSSNGLSIAAEDEESQTRVEEPAEIYRAKQTFSGCPSKYEDRLHLSDQDMVFLHLSDLHLCGDFPYDFPKFPNGTDKKEILKILEKDLQEMNVHGKIDKIIISGDFTEKATADEFDLALYFLEELKKRTHVETTDMIFLAGNHDVSWSSDPLTTVVDPRKGTSAANYERFCKLMQRPELLEEAVHLTKVFSKDGKNLLRIVTIESNYVEGPETGGIGYFGTKHLDKAEELIKASDQQDQVANISTWLVTHHHIFPATSATVHQAEKKQLSLTANVPELIDFAIDNNIEAILHGHEHQPLINQVWPVFVGSKTVFQPLLTIGAGSFGSPKDHLGPFGKNHYYLICKKPDKVIVKSRSYNYSERSFRPHESIVIPTSAKHKV